MSDRPIIGEKFFHFLEASFDHPEFAAEILAFVSEIKSILQPWEISEFFDDLQQGKVFDRQKAFNGQADDDEREGPDECDVMRDGEKILLAQNAKRLLLGE